MAEGGHHHRDLNQDNQEPHSNSSSGHGSMDENSTYMKLVSLGDQQAPSMDTDGIDLMRGRQRPEMGQMSSSSHPGQVNDHLGLAERQESYRTLQSECSNLQSLTIVQEVQRTQANPLSAPAAQLDLIRTHPSESYGGQPLPMAQGTTQARMITSLTGAYNPAYNIVASIENNEAANIPVRTAGARHISPLQSSSDNENVQSNSVTSNGRNLQNSQDSNDSRAARSVHCRQHIDDNTLIHELPLDFIKFLSATFDRQDCKNWKDLVNLYNWNFKQIILFKNKNHPDGIFCSLLNENEFQQYNILHLKEDLLAIPRKDALEDLNKMIHRYNSQL